MYCSLFTYSPALSRLGCLLFLISAFHGSLAQTVTRTNTVEIPVETIQDKIRGGLLGQLLGDLNGLKHEMKYIAEPGMSPTTPLPCPAARGPTTIRISSGSMSWRWKVEG